MNIWKSENTEIQQLPEDFHPWLRICKPRFKTELYGNWFFSTHKSTALPPHKSDWQDSHDGQTTNLIDIKVIHKG